MVRRDPRAETGLFGGAAILMRMGKHRSATVTLTTLRRWGATILLSRGHL
jgi:hypothetical protein